MSVRHLSGLMKFPSFGLCSGKRRHNVTNRAKCLDGLLFAMVSLFLCSSVSKSYHPFSYLAAVSSCSFFSQPLQASGAALQLSHPQTMFRLQLPANWIWFRLPSSWDLCVPCHKSSSANTGPDGGCLKAWTIPVFYRGNTGEL